MAFAAAEVASFEKVRQVVLVQQMSSAPTGNVLRRCVLRGTSFAVFRAGKGSPSGRDLSAVRAGSPRWSSPALFWPES
jgi:hypothetical protein